MKTLATLITMMVLTLPVSARAQNNEMRADIDKDIPLAEAIRRANKQFPDVQPLTEQEVIAAVRAIRLKHPQITEAVYEIYQTQRQIARHRRLAPVGDLCVIARTRYEI